MANTKITDLTSRVPAQTGDEFPINRSGLDGKLTVGSVQTPWLSDIDAGGFDLLFDDGTGIRDSSDNELLLFHEVASAINYLQIANAATNNSPEISAQGDNGNIPITFTAKGGPSSAGGSMIFNLGTINNATAVFTNTSAGDGGAIMRTYHNSASPAVNDYFFGLQGRANDSGGNPSVMAELDAKFLDPTNGSEDAQLEIWTMVAGTITLNTQFGNGVLVGASPTGGYKGAGTINASGDIYKNDSAYTNPDYALEHYFEGRIEQFADKPGAKDYCGLIPLPKVELYLKQHKRLPGIKDESAGIFERGDRALEKIEEAWIYITQLHKRIEQLEQRTRLP